MGIRYYVAFSAVPEPSIIPCTPSSSRHATSPAAHAAMTFTGFIGAVCMFPLRAIIAPCVALRIHPNTLTLIGVLINVGAAWALGFGRFVLAGVIMICRQHLRLHRRQGRAPAAPAVASSARSGTRRSIASPISRC